MSIEPNYDHDCLHCRLARTIREWSNERHTAGDDPTAEEIGIKVGEFLCDVALNVREVAPEGTGPQAVIEYATAVQEGQNDRLRLLKEEPETAH